MDKLKIKSLMMGLVFSVSAVAQTAMAVDQLEVTFINVGQGDGTLIKCPDDTHVLVDLGSTRPYVRKEKEAANKIKAEIKTMLPESLIIDTLVLTHGDLDHYNLWGLIKNNKINQVIHGGQPRDYGFKQDDKTIFEYLKSDEYKISSSSISSPTIKKLPFQYSHDPINTPTENIIECGEASIRIVGANVMGVFNKRSKIKNRNSIVLRVSYQDYSVLLTGDSTEDTENRILVGDWNIKRGTERSIQTIQEQDKNSLKRKMVSDHTEGSSAKIRRTKSSSVSAPRTYLTSSVLKVAHHGSKDSTSPSWISAVQPAMAVVSAGNKRYYHPSCEVDERLKNTLKEGVVEHDNFCFKQNGVTDNTKRKKYIFTTTATIAERGYQYDGISYKFVIPKTGYPSLYEKRSGVEWLGVAIDSFRT